MNMTLGRTWHAIHATTAWEHHEGVQLVLRGRGAACCELLTRDQRSVMPK